MSESEPLADVVSRLLAGQASKQVRTAAARGALPLSRAILVRLYLFLRSEDDKEVANDAERSLAGLTRDVVLEVLSDPDCPPEVLDHYAAEGMRDEPMAERIAFHKSVPIGAMGRLARGGTAGVIELVLTNQQRLLSQPDLLNLLSVNPALRPDQRGRILELLDRAVRSAAAADAARERNERAEADPEITDEMQEAARLLQVDIGEFYAASEILGGEEFAESEDPEIRGAYQRILTLNVAQKAVLAMRGGREERLILIRDTNKLVASGVIRNPRITESDIEAIARMRNVSDEVLRQIGHNREWTKNYTVIKSLVNNPRTPQGVSTNFVPRLQTQDLKRLAASREVPELIRRMAKRTLEVRTRKRN